MKILPLLSLLAFTFSLFATPVEYVFTFDTTSGLAPTSGLFIYDGAAPQGAKYEGFVIDWDNFVFNLGYSTQSGAFANLSPDPIAALVQGGGWNASGVNPATGSYSPVLDLTTTQGTQILWTSGCPLDGCNDGTAQDWFVPFVSGSGSFTIVDPPIGVTPEPSTWLLGATAFAAIFGFRRYFAAGYRKGFINRQPRRNRT